jgi:hypothetical protein
VAHGHVGPWRTRKSGTFALLALISPTNSKNR